MFKGFWFRYGLFCLLFLLLGLIIIKHNQIIIPIDVINTYNNDKKQEIFPVYLYLYTKEEVVVPLYVEVKLDAHYEIPFYQDEIKTDFDKEIYLRYSLLTNLANYLPQGLFSPLPKHVRLLDYYIEGDTLVLNLDKGFEELNKANERIILTSIIYTFTSIKGINKIRILCDYKPIKFKHFNKEVFSQDDVITNYLITGYPYREQSKYKIYYYLKKGDNYYLVPVLVYDNPNTSIEQLLKQPPNNSLETFIDADDEIFGLLGYYQYYLSLLYNGFIETSEVNEENVLKMINFYEIALN